MENHCAGDDRPDLLISGLQHFSFCRRQWALIHIEGEWAENYFTVDGAILHEKADDPYATEKRGDQHETGEIPLSPSQGV